MFILLKGLLLELSGHGNPHDHATPKVIPDSNICILGLSNEVSILLERWSKQSKRLTENLAVCIHLSVSVCIYFKTGRGYSITVPKIP